jgi:hypothetical protein
MCAAFCTVIINKLSVHLSPSITLGNFQCSAAVPVFSTMGVMIA